MQAFHPTLEAKITAADAKYEFEFSDSDVADARTFARELITDLQEGNQARATFRFPIFLALIGRERAKALLGKYYDQL